MTKKVVSVMYCSCTTSAKVLCDGQNITFGGINLEDIRLQAFEIERRLKEELDIPVMHDDQHERYMLLLNALELAGKNPRRTNRNFWCW
jgi:malic enzyme